VWEVRFIISKRYQELRSTDLKNHDIKDFKANKLVESCTSKLLELQKVLMRGHIKKNGTVVNMNNTLLAWRSSFLSPVKFTIWYIYLQMTQETFSFNSWLRDISDSQNDNLAKLMSEPFEAGRKDKKLKRVKFKTFEAVFCSVGWLPRKKDRGARRKFWKEPLGSTKIMFCERGLKNFSPQRSQFQNNKLCGKSLFSAQCLERYCQKLPLWSFWKYWPL